MGTTRGRGGSIVSPTCSNPETRFNPARSNRHFTKLKVLLAACFEALVDSLAVFGGDRYLLVLFSKLLVDECDRVIARGEALNLILSVFRGDCEERALHHADVHLHPWVLVALDRQHDFFASEILLDRCRGWRLRLIPFPVVFGGGMDVESGGIGVLFEPALPGSV